MQLPSHTHAHQLFQRMCVSVHRAYFIPVNSRKISACFFLSQTQGQMAVAAAPNTFKIKVVVTKEPMEVYIEPCKESFI